MALIKIEWLAESGKLSSAFSAQSESRYTRIGEELKFLGALLNRAWSETDKSKSEVKNAWSFTSVSHMYPCFRIGTTSPFLYLIFT